MKRKLNLEKEIIKALWEKNLSEKKLIEKFKISCEELNKKCKHLSELNLIDYYVSNKNIIWEIKCICKKPNKIIYRNHGNLEEVLDFYKKRSCTEKLFNSYRTYDDTKEKRGNEKEWQEQIREVLGLNGLPYDEFMEILGIDKLPDTIQELQKIRKQIMKKVHPDVGGDNDLAAKVNKAFEELAKRI